MSPVKLKFPPPSSDRDSAGEKGSLANRII